MAGNDFSAGCGGKIVQSIHATGRTGFTVTIGEKGAVSTWSGMEGAKPDADSQLQSLDKVMLNLGIDGVLPTSTDVTGNCAYSNPYKGPMTISCQGSDSSGGAYLLQFRTDGSEPLLADLNVPSASDDQVFKVGSWIGSRLEGDPDMGCLMARKVNPKVTLMVYANANEAFTISIFNQDWDFAISDKLDGDLLFDGTSVPLSWIEVRNEHVLTLHGGDEEAGYQSLFESGSEIMFRMGRQQVTATLDGSKAATERLWACVG
jgi:hypothetical protein